MESIEVKLGMKPLATRRIMGIEVCDVMEAARVLGVSRVAVHHYMAAGRVEFVVLPGSGLRKVRVASVRKLLKAAVRKGSAKA